EFPVSKPDLLSHLDHGEGATALDLHISRDTAEHGAGQETPRGEPAEEKPNADEEHPRLPLSRSANPAANTCGERGKAFGHKSALAKHRKIHSGDRPHACADCGKGFIQRSDLAAHRHVHTG
ncbi:XFIN protein, partial [Chaetops frenatus]|nr:XFIN protein [Chaetops frenatus]